MKHSVASAAILLKSTDAKSKRDAKSKQTVSTDDAVLFLLGVRDSRFSSSDVLSTRAYYRAWLSRSDSEAARIAFDAFARNHGLVVNEAADEVAARACCLA